LCNGAEIHALDGAVNIDDKLLLTFMGNEDGTECLGVPVAVDEATELGKDGELYIVGPEP
jgi:hypothetical protein